MDRTAITPPPPPLSSREPLTTDTAGRTARVVDDALGQVALDGERAHARARVFICLGAAVLWPCVNLLGGGADVENSMGVEVAAIVTLVASLAMAIRLRGRTRVSWPLVTASMGIDLAGAIAICAAVVFAPPADYSGLLHTTGMPILYIAVLTAAVRLSRRLSILGGVVAGISLFALHLADSARNAAISVDGPPHLLIATMLLGTAAGVAWVGASRTRAAALGAAEQTVRFERARDTLGAYVSTEVAEEALRQSSLQLGGKRQRVAVVFTDLRSFTSTSEDADPAAIVAQLNAYFEVMVAVVSKHGGVVDKYIGDAIMAVFGAPTPRDDDAARAVAAALELGEALVHHNRDRAARGLPPLAHGVGVHVGDVIAGNIGTSRRAQYTVIGDTVNVAARLESETKSQGVEVLISADAAEASGHLARLRPVGSVQVKGRAGAIAVFTAA